MTLLRRRAVIRFGEFEVDLSSRQLRKQGQTVRLQEKPFEALTVLLEKAGEIVSRDELRTRLWPDINHGDLDHNLNVCVAKLRALLELHESPRYIQTISTHGYCFIAPVEVEEEEDLKGRSARIRVAVLSLDSWNTFRQQSFCNCLVAEISARLGHLYPEQLAVIAQSSIVKYRNTSKTPAQIGRELKVDYILETSVRGGGKHLHITTELVRVKDETYFWAESYDYSGGDPITIQNQVADSVAQFLGLKLLLHSE